MGVEALGLEAMRLEAMRAEAMRACLSGDDGAPPGSHKARDQMGTHATHDRCMLHMAEQRYVHVCFATPVRAACCVSPRMEAREQAVSTPPSQLLLLRRVEDLRPERRAFSSSHSPLRRSPSAGTAPALSPCAAVPARHSASRSAHCAPRRSFPRPARPRQAAPGAKAAS